MKCVGTIQEKEARSPLGWRKEHITLKEELRAIDFSRTQGTQYYN